MTARPSAGNSYGPLAALTIFDERIGELEAEWTGKDVDWIIPLGDNWLSAWNWATRVERETGADHQMLLRLAYDRFFCERNQRGGRK